MEGLDYRNRATSTADLPLFIVHFAIPNAFNAITWSVAFAQPIFTLKYISFETTARSSAPGQPYVLPTDLVSNRKILPFVCQIDVVKWIVMNSITPLFEHETRFSFIASRFVW